MLFRSALTGNLIGEPKIGHTSTILDIAFGYYGQSLAIYSSDSDSEVFGWSLESTLPRRVPNEEHDAPITSLGDRKSVV